MSPDLPHSSPPPLFTPEELPYPQGFDHLSTEERNNLFGEDQIKKPDFWGATVQSRAEDRLQPSVVRQSVAGPSTFDLRSALGLALIFGAVLIMTLPVPQQQLQSHPRCGITTGGKV